MKKIALISLFLALGATASFACTNLIVGKKASTDGSVFITYSADSYCMFGQLVHFPAGKWAKGTMLPIHEWDTGKYLGEIEQAPETYNVIGNINEYQVSIAETTFGGRPELVDTTGILDYGSLIYITLQRSRTAREAIEVMTDLVKEYGYYSSGESFSIADPEEAWILEMIGKGPGVKGAVWAAVRIPDDCISAHANQSRIRQLTFDDKDNCLFSPDVISFAREKGYFNGKNSEFSFSEAYAPADFSTARFCEGRVWSFFNRYVSGMDKYLPYVNGENNDGMPLYVKPERKLSLEDVRDMMRDHYEGTPLDMSNDVVAGPYSSPYRFPLLEFEVDGKKYFNDRPISTYQTAFSFVSQLRAWLPDAVGGVIWFTLDDANMSVFTPVYCGADEVPACYAANGASDTRFSWDNAYWIYNWVANMVYPRYSLMFGDLKEVRDRLEKTYVTVQPGFERVAAALYDTDKEALKQLLNSYTASAAQTAFQSWKELAEFLIVRYNDNVKKEVKDGKFVLNANGRCNSFERPAYDKQFMEQVIKLTGDRYVYPQPTEK